MSTIFITDLDGTLLGHDDFGFAVIRDDVLAFLAAGVPIIPNSSKTRAEVSFFCDQLGVRLPFICENGAALVNADLLGADGTTLMPPSIMAGQPVGRLMSEWVRAVDPELREQCLFIDALDPPRQTAILGLSGDDLARALARQTADPPATMNAKTGFLRLAAQTGKAVFITLEAEQHRKLAGQHDKSTFNSLIRDIHETGNRASSMIGFGDSENDLAMLCSVDIACVVPRPGAPLLRLHNPPDTVIIAPQPAPEGWIFAANEAVMAVQQKRQTAHG